MKQGYCTGYTGSNAYVLVGAAADLQRADLLLHSTVEPPPLGPPDVKNCLDAYSESWCMQDERQVEVVTDMLNLSPYSSAGSNHQAHQPLYRLSAVVNHLGSMTSGHYTAHCQSASTGMWFHCNDNTVSTVSEATHVGGASSEAYMLLYSRQDQS